ncbi:MAG: nitrilase [Candidatus Hydrogenedentota bacterium]|nr:MAG: nitrilase [Candidatus Hydrogenedentota bacterium]
MITKVGVKVALIPFRPKLGCVDENIEHIKERTELALDQKARVILFPELSTSGYLLESLVFESAITLKDSRLDYFKEQSRYADICFGAVVQDNHRFFNAALYFREGDLHHIHKKIYLPTYGMFDESRYFTKGETLSVFSSAMGKTAILICEDAWHPVLVYAAYMQHAENIIILSASPDRGIENSGPDPDSFSFWEMRLLVYAQSFGCRFIYVNRGGVEDGVRFGGRVIVASPLLVEKEWEKEEIVFVQIDNSELTRSAMIGGPFCEENFILNNKILQEAEVIRKQFEGDKFV